MQRQKRVERACAMLAGFLSLCVLSSTLSGQCSAGPQAAERATAPQDASQIHRLFEEKNWPEVARIAGATNERRADLNYEYGLALAHLQQWAQARAALMAGARECPRQKRFYLELAGIAFEQKRYPEAAAWLRRGLKLDPNDEYANDFAGSDYLLMGNMNAALKYWNRVHKPYISALDFDPQLRVQRLILDRAFAFSPAAVLEGTRLRNHR